MTEEIDGGLEVTPAAGSKSAATKSTGGGGGANDDLSKDLARTLTRAPLEQITCRRVGDHHYRCNWWTPQATVGYDNPSMLGSLVTTSRISKSQFVHATRTGGKLTVRVMNR